MNHLLIAVFGRQFFVTQRSIQCKLCNPQRTPDLSPSDRRFYVK
ncbi:MAG TPA: hypothetical protein VE944_19905 [Nostoc sp.]|nr:hypothetical protein [Nostoc sp.]HYX16586.1 hypothetical protein [Nostoc sp.]